LKGVGGNKRIGGEKLRAGLLFAAAIAGLIGVSFLLNVETRKGEMPTPRQATFRPGKTAVVRTTKGTFSFVLYQKDMPRTTKNFIRLARSGFYNGTVFHRYEPGFVIQGGAPKPGQKPAPKIEFETCLGLVHKPGTVAMARVGTDYDSADSQFYISLKRAPQLDGQYAVFGQVTSGMDVVRKLRRGDRIISIAIVRTPRR